MSRASLRFRLDEDTDTLVREVLDASGGTPRSTRLLLDAVVRPDGAPVFRYFDAAGSELTPAPMPRTASPIVRPGSR